MLRRCLMKMHRYLLEAKKAFAILSANVQGRKRLPLSCDKMLFATFFNFRLLRAPDKTTPALIVGILPQDLIDAHTDSVTDLRLYTTLSVRAILFYTLMTFLHYLASALLSF